MTPEQARGKAVDKRADIWAFGCVLYEMLTGRPAFPGEDVTSTLARVLERDPDLSAAGRSRPTCDTRSSSACKRTSRSASRTSATSGLRSKASSRNRPRPRARSGVARCRSRPCSRRRDHGGRLRAGVWSLRRAGFRAAPLPVTRFVITPPATAPLANLGGYDVVISPDGKRLAYFAQDPQTAASRSKFASSTASRRGASPEPRCAAVGNRTRFSRPTASGSASVRRRGVIRVASTAPAARDHRRAGAGFPRRRVGGDDTLIYSSGTRLQRVSAERRRHAGALLAGSIAGVVLVDAPCSCRAGVPCSSA